MASKYWTEAPSGISAGSFSAPISSPFPESNAYPDLRWVSGTMDAVFEGTPGAGGVKLRWSSADVAPRPRAPIQPQTAACPRSGEACAHDSLRFAECGVPGPHGRVRAFDGRPTLAQ